MGSENVKVEMDTTIYSVFFLYATDSFCGGKFPEKNRKSEVFGKN
jgi:hypothetical protein